MPTTLSAVSIANVALSKIGAQAIGSMTDATSASAIAVNNNWELAYLEVSRSGRWNCLLTTSNLVQVPQIPLPGCTVPANPATWAPYTTYAANTYLTYGGYYYLVMFTYTSTNDFTNDLTTGALTQTNLPTSNPLFPGQNGAQYESGWAYKYRLPSDFQLLVVLNDNWYWGAAWGYGWDGGGGDGNIGTDYQLMGEHLFCNQNVAIIQYVKNQPDTSQFDSMFTNALTLKLASAIATTLRQDGGTMETQLLAGYEQALRAARTKNGGERQMQRFNPINGSRFNQSRYNGING